MDRRKTTRQKAENVPSLLLENSENEFLFSAFGRGKVTLATGVVQLYTADAPSRQRWSKRCSGVACFLKDNPNRSYYIRVYNIKTGDMIWEQEIYNQFKYKAPREYFHTFEADDVQAGLNFASEDEAHKFKVAIEQKLLERHKRRIDKKKTVRRPETSGNREPPPQRSPAQSSGPKPSSSEVSLTKIGDGKNTVKGKKDNKKDKGGKKKLTKEDISTPTEFRHVSHVGWDPNKGFDMDNVGADMKDLFTSVGIKDGDIVDEETVEFIYDFVDKYGGIDAVKKEMANRPPPAAPLPPTPAPAPPSRVPASKPQQQPPPPSRNTPPAPPSRSAGPPPPPPSSRTGRSNAGPPPPPPSKQQASPAAPPPPPPSAPPPMSSGGGPPPPPPPPPPSAPSAPAAPPPPPMNANAGGGGDGGRGGLLSQIRGGASLKAPTPAATPAPPDARGDLLSAIRGGAQLKHIDHSEEKPAASSGGGGGIVGALAKALAERQTAIQGSDDSDEDDDEDDDEWSD